MQSHEVTKLLRGTLDRIEDERSWNREWFACDAHGGIVRPESKEATTWSLIGAMLRTRWEIEEGVRTERGLEWVEAGMERCRAAYDRLNEDGRWPGRRLGRRGSGESNLNEINERCGHRAVCAMLREAIEADPAQPDGSSKREGPAQASSSAAIPVR